MRQARSSSLLRGGSKLIRAGLDFLFPPECAGCGALGHLFCPRCAQAVIPVPPTICARCGRVFAEPTVACAHCRAGALEGLLAVRGAALYTEPLRRAIHIFKYNERADLAEPLARYLFAVFAKEPWSRLAPTLDAVLPVPLHPQRLAERGYNQSALLAQAFAERAGLTFYEDWLARVRFTRPQVGLGSSERRANVERAFAATAQVAGRNLLLIDDVFTTGATLQACAMAARAAGAKHVYGLTLGTASDPL